MIASDKSVPASAESLAALLKQIRACTICEKHLPLGPRPVVQAGLGAKIIIISQAPGLKVHETGVPFNDPSGKRLRQWLGLTDEEFYNPELVAIMPMGFCYPGRGKSGDLPPRPECAPQWHDKLLAQLSNVELVLLIGQYAQNYYLKDNYKTLTERVQHWREFMPKYFVTPHPSPRNQMWLKKNPWFEAEAVPELQHLVRSLLKK